MLEEPLDRVWNGVLVENGGISRGEKGKEAVLAYPRLKAGKINIMDISILAVQHNGVYPSTKE